MSLRFAIKTWNFLKIDDRGRFTGPIAPIFLKLMFLPPNCTFVPLQNLKDPLVNSLGVQADIIPNMLDLPSLPANLTTGPSFEALDCFLLSKVLGKKELRTRAFDETLETIDTESRVLVLGLLFFSMFLFKFVSKTPVNEVLWKFFILIFEQSSRKLWNKGRVMKIALMVTILSFFIKIILSSFVNTKMIALDHSRRINTFEDLLKVNLTLQFSNQFRCETALNPRLHSLRGIQIDESSTRRPTVVLWILRESMDTCILTEKSILEYQISLICGYLGQNQAFSERVHKSREPVITRAQYLYLLKTLNQKSMKNAIQWAYGSLERGIYKMAGSIGRRLFKRFPIMESVRCLQPNRNVPIAQPLAVRFVLSFFSLSTINQPFGLLNFHSRVSFSSNI